MIRPNLEQRVASLESQVEKLADNLRAVGKTKGAKKDWRRAVEKYTGDVDLQSVFAEATKLREADRSRVKRTRPPTRGKKR